MKKFKRNIALVITLCMVLTSIVPAYADEIAAPEEPVMQQEVSDTEVSEIINDSEPEETASDGISYEDETILEDIEQATPANADYIKQEETPDDPDIYAFEEATPANAEYTNEKFIRETVVDGIKITLIADAGVFPEDAELWAEKVEDEDTEEVIEEAVEKERDNRVNVAKSYKFDIKMLLDGEEVQPDTGKGSVKVTFTLEEKLNDCLTASAYHLKEEADGELTAENLGAEVKTVEEAAEETVKEADDTSETVKTIDTDEDEVLEDGVIEDDVTKTVTILEAETDGFSYYVVEFTYDELQYVLPGDSRVKLSEILKTFSIKGTVSEAEVSNQELFTVTEDEDGNDWTVTALQEFTSKEWMKVTVDGTEYEITVTDSTTVTTDYYYYENGEMKKGSVSATIVQPAASDYKFEAGQWYLLNSDITTDFGFYKAKNQGTVDDPAHVIIGKNATVNIDKGISNTSGHSLIIYTQDIDNPGIINAGAVNDAGIGGDSFVKDAGNLRIDGGIINVNGGSHCAGIGGGFEGSGGSITINGGTVTATGGEDGAGIGGGFKGSGGSITINGGTVTANGNNGGSGIGVGDSGNSGSITINGGTVTANGSERGAGIGGGFQGNADSIIVNGGIITAIGGIYAAGIGGGFKGSGGSITIKGGTVTAYGGDNGTGIGGGEEGSVDHITIVGGTVTAIAKYNNNGIGKGYLATGNPVISIGEKFTVFAGETLESIEKKDKETYSYNDECVTPRVTATASYIDENGLSKEEECILLDSESRVSFTLVKDFWYAVKENVNVVERIINSAGTGNPAHLILTDGNTLTVPKGISNQSGKSLIIYGQTENTGQLIINAVNSGDAGIGGDYDTDFDKYDHAGTLTVVGGNIRITTGGTGASIGGGSSRADNGGSGGNLIVYGGTIEATSSGAGAAIGGGSCGHPISGGSGCRMTVYGGSIKANGKYSAIGGGCTTGKSEDTAGGELFFYKGEVTAYSENTYGIQADIYADRDIAVKRGESEASSIDGKLEEYQAQPTHYVQLKPAQTVSDVYVVFNSMGGSEVAMKTVKSGEKVDKPADPTRTGYTFCGWYKEAACTNSWNFAADIVNNTITLYAKWTSLQYEISWKNDEDVTLATSMAAYGELPVCPDKAKFIKEGYVHTGWTPAVEAATKETSYKATYEEKLEGYHVVSFDSQGGSAEAAVNVLHNHTLASPSNAPERTGYKFGGWKKADGGAFGFGTETVIEDMILTASWTAEKYEITWSVDGNTSTSQCDYGELPVYTGSTAKTGYVFTGWSPAIKAATSAITYTAQYYEIVHVHTPKIVSGQPAKCTEDGYKDCYQCTGCNKYFEAMSCTSESEITDYEAWKTGDGKIAKTGHSTIHILQKDATVEAYGYKEHWYCINCKKYFSDSACSGEIGDAAALETWKAKAQSEGGGRIEKLAPHTHTYGTATYYWSEDLTQCTGYHTCTDSSCQYTESETVEAVKGDTQYTATFTKSGFTTQYKDIPIPTHVHTFAEGWTSNAIAHWHTATCDHKDVVSGFAEHTWGTGADASKCIFCGYEKVIPKPEKVVVDFNTDGGSFIVAQHIEKGSKATRPSNPTKEGYKFDNWYTDTSYSTPFDFTGVINNDTTVYAKWTPNGKEQYTITWKDYDGKLLATSIVDERDIPKYPGASKPSRSGYIFTGWTPEIDLATADTTYTATYEKKSSGGGGGGGSGSGGGGGGSAVIAYAEKPTVTPITVAANGYQMMGTAVVSIPPAQLAKSGAAPVPGAWSKANGMWTYTKADGNKAKNEWVLITVAGGNASYFYFDSNSNMVTGWQQVGGKWMFFNNESGPLLGACLRGPGRTPDGYEIDASGVWTGR